VNLTQAIAELKARGFDYLSDARATIMLNNGKNALEDEWEWPWLEATTVTGTAPLTISDLRSVLYVADTTTGNSLIGVDARDVNDIDTNLTTAGTPLMWWLDGTSTLRTYPTSTTAQISARYLRYSSELSAGSDTPAIPVRYHPIWVQYGVVEAYLDDDRFNEAGALLNFIRTNRLPQLIDVFESRNRQGPQVQVLSHGSEDW
jgi:hypothetical protein